jgi:hypothetical protein
MQVKVNRQEWEKLGVKERALIGDVVGGYFKGAEIVPEAGVPESAGLGSSVGSFCEAACNLAQAAAEAACQSIEDPLGKAVCLAAAKSAGDLCRSKC